MKNLCVFLLAVVLTISMIACSPTTVMLHCDAEGCENTVAVEQQDNMTIDEDWVIYCESCADKILDD